MTLGEALSLVAHTSATRAAETLCDFYSRADFRTRKKGRDDFRSWIVVAPID
jgi:hypothetical protein